MRLPVLWERQERANPMLITTWLSGVENPPSTFACKGVTNSTQWPFLRDALLAQHRNNFTKVTTARGPPEVLGWLTISGSNSLLKPHRRICLSMNNWLRTTYSTSGNLLTTTLSMCDWRPNLGQLLQSGLPNVSRSPRGNLALWKATSGDPWNSQEADSYLPTARSRIQSNKGQWGTSGKGDRQLCGGNLPTSCKRKDYSWACIFHNIRELPTWHWQPIYFFPTELRHTCHRHQETLSSGTLVWHFCCTESVYKEHCRWRGWGRGWWLPIWTLRLHIHQCTFNRSVPRTSCTGTICKGRKRSQNINWRHLGRPWRLIPRRASIYTRVYATSTKYVFCHRQPSMVVASVP